MPDHVPDHMPDHVPDQPVDGRRRLVDAMTRRPSGGQVVAGLLLALLGFAAAVQVSALRSETPYAGARRGDLVSLLQSLSAAQDRATRQLADLQETRDALEESTTQRAAALEEAQRQLGDLRILAGAIGAEGPGVRITITDPDGTVGARTLLNAVEELRDAGAEAIEINDQARVVAATYLTDGSDPIDGELDVGGTTVRAPYVVDAIGSPETLAEATVFPGGLTDEVEDLGGTVSVETPETIRVTSLAPPPDTEFVEPST
ncbi:MAG: DUF881 domain-containing protein [Nocardioidaceae bacterium]|nr:DUF881 domain-containing protein [Nocardioidaceae bacterium]